MYIYIRQADETKTKGMEMNQEIKALVNRGQKVGDTVSVKIGHSSFADGEKTVSAKVVRIYKRKVEDDERCIYHAPEVTLMDVVY